MRYQHVQPEDLAWSARQTAMPKDPLHEVLEADIEAWHDREGEGGTYTVSQENFPDGQFVPPVIV